MYNHHLPPEGGDEVKNGRKTNVTAVKQWLRKNLAAIVIAASLLLAGILTIQDGWQRLPGGLEQLHHSALSPRLAGPKTIGQTFICPCVELNRIAVLPRFSDAPSADLVLHLRASPDAEHDLRTATIRAADLRSDEYAYFDFAPVTNSADTGFYFYVESPHATEDGEAETWLLRTTDDVYAWGQLYVDGRPANGDLSFKASCSPSAAGVVINVLRHINDYKPLLCGNTVFYAVLAVSYLGVMVLLWWRLRALLTQERM
ncbi:MAG: hypothetical protein NUW24_07895 [Anaerolineae bacterium]|jgi:hypothetical protein|nr:hypothetical protein [Anaerolineae bacterium]